MKNNKRICITNLDRNYDDPKYKRWRQAVAKRDNYRCQWPKCRSSKFLRFHHIRTWAQYPALRFELDNGITLCKKHHDMVWQREDIFAPFFCFILVQKKRSRNANK